MSPWEKEAQRWKRNEKYKKNKCTHIHTHAHMCKIFFSSVGFPIFVYFPRIISIIIILKEFWVRIVFCKKKKLAVPTMHVCANVCAILCILFVIVTRVKRIKKRDTRCMKGWQSHPFLQETSYQKILACSREKCGRASWKKSEFINACRVCAGALMPHIFFFVKSCAHSDIFFSKLVSE